MKYVVINLDRSVDRLSFIEAQFRLADRDFVRFSAIGNAIVDGDPQVRATKFEGIFGRKMTNGELGCFKSHVQCLRDFVASGDDVILILEDDVTLSPEAFAMIEELPRALSAASENWQCVNLSSSYPKRFSRIARIEGHELRRSWQFPILASALMWSRAGAQNFLKDLDKKGIYAPFDDQVRYVLTRTGQGFSFDRSPISLAHFGSDIGLVDCGSDSSTRNPAKKVRKNSLKNVIKRTPLYGWSLLHVTMYRLGMLR